MNFLRDSQITIGPLVLNTYLLYILIGIGAGSILLLISSKNDKNIRKFSSDIINNFFLIVILTYKFLPLLLSPGDIISNPINILYVSGGTTGLVLGSFFGLVYILVKLIITGKKNRKRSIENGTQGKEGQNLLLADVIKSIMIFFVTAAVVSLFLVLVSGIVRDSDIIDTDENVINRPLMIGDIAPGFELIDLDGNNISPGEYRGKWVILNFWASWCPPCRAELPTLNRFYKDMDKDNVVLIGINATGTENPAGRDVRDYISNFVNEEGIDFPVLLDMHNRKYVQDEGLITVSTLYGAESLPTTIVISPDGIITKIKTGVVDSYWLRSAVQDN
jgi:peroxiredoxin